MTDLEKLAKKQAYIKAIDIIEQAKKFSQETDGLSFEDALETPIAQALEEQEVRIKELKNKLEEIEQNLASLGGEFEAINKYWKQTLESIGLARAELEKGLNREFLRDFDKLASNPPQNSGVFRVRSYIRNALKIIDGEKH